MSRSSSNRRRPSASEPSPAPPPAGAPQVRVLGQVSLGSQRPWLPVGEATLDRGCAGQALLRIQMGAVPADMLLYIPLRDLLLLLGEPEQAAAEPSGHA